MIGDPAQYREHDPGGLDAVIAVPAVLEVNPRSVLIASRAGSPALRRRLEPRAGRFVAVASAAPLVAYRCSPSYCASMAGVTGLVRALAAELRGTGVTTNAVSTGSTATPILDESARAYGLESAEGFCSEQPIAPHPPRRDRRCDRLARQLGGGAFTGARVPVDGGLCL